MTRVILNKGEASSEPSKQPLQPEIQEALNTAWAKIEQGARRRMQENREKLQEMYQHENKPPLLGHVEQVTAESTKTEIELEQPSDQPLEQPSSSQQEKSVLLTDPEEQLTEALQEQERWEQLQERMGAGEGDGDGRPKEKRGKRFGLGG